MAIVSFKGKTAEAIWQGKAARGFPPDVLRRAQVKLAMLHHAATLDDLRVPLSNHLEMLKGDRTGQYSVRINKQWRVCFIWSGSDAHAVEIVDYH